MSYDIKLEIEILKLGFKRQWFEDKSGYWFIKKVKYKDLKLKFYVESDNKVFHLEALTYDFWYEEKLVKQNYEILAKFKCDIKTIKQTLKKYK